jgi:NDP-sugar pyrophosphorylase family protein
MALTYRQTKGSALTIEELDANFQYFTGSHSVTGSQVTSGSSTVIGNSTVTGSQVTSGSSTVIGNSTVTGSQVVSGSSTVVGNLIVTGSILISGSALITLTTQSILPSAATNPASFAVSSSGIPFFSSGGAWIALF